MKRAIGGVLIAAAAVTFVVAGKCSRDEPPAVTAPPPAAGYARVVGDNFTIDMPVGWAQPPVEPAAFDQAAAALRGQNPNLAAALDVVRGSLGQGTRLFAIDPADGSSANLIVTGAGDQSLNALVRDAVRQLVGVGVATPKESRVRVGRHLGVRLEFDLPVRGSTGSLSVPETQLYVVAGDQLYVLTLFGDNPSLPVVAESLRIT